MSRSGLAYLDASAFVKLVAAEPESQALRAELIAWPQAIASELLEVEAQRFDAGPQMWVVQAALVGVEGVVEGPERALEGDGLGGSGKRRGARVLGLQREVAEDAAHGQRGEAGVRRRAGRAREVAVHDDQWSVGRAADVVVLAHRRHGGAAKIIGHADPCAEA